MAFFWEYLRFLSHEQAMLNPPPSQPMQPDTAFQEGGRAPGFELPDRTGRRISIATLADREVMLSFVSDDPRSRAFIRYVATLAGHRSRAGRSLPRFVAVADFEPSVEAAFRKQTGLDQVFLYEEQGGSVESSYSAQARPRCFQLGPGLSVTVLGGSPASVPLYDIGMEVLQGWRFRSPAMAGLEFQAPPPDGLRAYDEGNLAGSPPASPGRTPD